MGNSASLSEYLSGTNYLEERQIRRFEMNDMINQDNSEFLKKFAWVYPMMCFDSDDTTSNENIENIFRENFNLKILKFIQNSDYLKKIVNEKKVYDFRKIRILIFMLTTNSNENDYSDKV